MSTAPNTVRLAAERMLAVIEAQIAVNNAVIAALTAPKPEPVPEAAQLDEAQEVSRG